MKPRSCAASADSRLMPMLVGEVRAATRWSGANWTLSGGSAWCAAWRRRRSSASVAGHARRQRLVGGPRHARVPAPPAAEGVRDERRRPTPRSGAARQRRGTTADRDERRRASAGLALIARGTPRSWPMARAALVAAVSHSSSRRRVTAQPRQRHGNRVQHRPGRLRDEHHCRPRAPVDLQVVHTPADPPAQPAAQQPVMAPALRSSSGAASDGRRGPARADPGAPSMPPAARRASPAR